MQIQMKLNIHPNISKSRSPRNNENDHVKIFAQKLTWRNGQDTAYNVRVIAHRLSQKLKVLNLLQANAPEKKSYNSHRLTHTVTGDRGPNLFLGAARVSHRDSVPKISQFNYERDLRYLLLKHSNQLKDLTNQKNWQVLVESKISRGCRLVALGVLLQFVAVV
jgi:hypothetical protein